MMKKSHPEYVIDGNHNKKAILLQIQEWEEIVLTMEELEDIRVYDNAKADRRRCYPFRAGSGRDREHSAPMSYSLNIRRSAQKSLAGIPQLYQTGIIEQIRHLADNPRPASCKKLTGRDAWRIRIGPYRVPYEIVSIGRRKEIHR